MPDFSSIRHFIVTWILGKIAALVSGDLKEDDIESDPSSICLKILHSAVELFKS